MKAYVNGATGLVGLSVIDAFLEAGHSIVASDRPSSNFTELEKRNVEVVPAELDDIEAIKRGIKGVDVVVHVAGLFDLGASPALLDSINRQGTINVCEATLEAAPEIKRFVQVSTVGVYGKPVRVPCREDDPKNPRNPYEKSKWKGEMAAFDYHKKHGLPVTAIRPTLVYGPRAKYGHAMFLAGIAMMKANGREVLWSLKSGPKSSHVHVEDVGRAALIVATNDAAVGRAFNVAAPEPLGGTEFIHALADPLEMPLKPIIPFIAPLMTATGALMPLVPNFLFKPLNSFLRKRWKELREQRGLTSDLDFRFDRDWVGYTTGDNYYDTDSLAKLGMEWKWPDTTAGLKSTVDWYRDREWLP